MENAEIMHTFKYSNFWLPVYFVSPYEIVGETVGCKYLSSMHFFSSQLQK